LFKNSISESNFKGAD